MMTRHIIITILGCAIFTIGCNSTSITHEINSNRVETTIEQKSTRATEIRKHQKESHTLKKSNTSTRPPNITEIITKRLQQSLGPIQRKQKRVFNVRRIDLGIEHGILITIDIISKNLSGAFSDDLLVNRIMISMMKESVRNFGYDKLYINIYNPSIISGVENLVIRTPHAYKHIPKVTGKYRPIKKLRTNGKPYLTPDSHNLANIVRRN